MKSTKKSYAVLLTIIAICLLLFPSIIASAQVTTPAIDLNPILTIIIQFAQLAGVAAVIAAIVNICKAIGWVKDTFGGQVTAGLDLLALIGLIALHYFAPTVSLQFVDNQAAVLAQILMMVLGYVLQLITSMATHNTLKTMNIPLIGFSHSPKAP